MTIATRADPSRQPLASGRPTATLAEAVVVLGLPVGLALGRQLWVQMRDGTIEIAPAFTDARLLTTLAAEILLALLLVAGLRRRGWHPRAQVGRPVLFDTIRGGVLWLATFAAVSLVRLVHTAIAPMAQQAAPHGHLAWWVVMTALAINPVFEEVLWLGYAIPTLARRLGIHTAALLSLGLRLAVHWNQGTLALTSILPVGCVWTAYYMRSRRLWPVVVAHVINNCIGFSAFVGG